MKIAVIDDDQRMCEAIARLIKKQNPEADIQKFSSGEEMQRTGENFSVYFLDIELEKMSGIELAKNIRQEQEKRWQTKSFIIFITGYREYMEDAFDVNAYHYLVKPINEEKFNTVFQRVWREIKVLEEQSKRFIMLKSSGTLQKVYLKDIYYIESSNKKVIFHTRKKRFEIYGKMDRFESELGSSFYRCHRCFLVNMESISAYSVDTIQILNGDKLILAQKKYSDFVKAYMKYAKDGGIVHV